MARFHKWTRTVPASIRLAGWFLCLSLAFSCTAAQPPRPSPPKPPPEGHWTEVLPNDLVEVRLEAHSDCALILGKRLGTKLQRGMVCLDAESGTVVWERSDPGLPGDLLVAPGRFIHSDRERLVAHDRTTGEVVWRFEAQTPIYGAKVADGQVVMSLDNEVLVQLDAATGAWRGGWRLDTASLKAVVERDGDSTWAIVVRAAQGDAQPMLVAVALRDGGPIAQLDQPAALPRPPEQWQTPITPWSFEVDRVGELLIGNFQENQLWGVRVEDGSVVWRQGLDRFEGERIMAPTRVLTHRLVKANDNPGDRTQVVEVHGWSPIHMGQGKPSWSLRVPSPYALLGLDPIPSAPARAFTATNDQLLVLDVEQGAVVWSYVLGPDASRWTSATSNGQAVFVLYRTPKSRAGALGRIPVLIE